MKCVLWCCAVVWCDEVCPVRLSLGYCVFFFFCVVFRDAPLSSRLVSSVKGSEMVVCYTTTPLFQYGLSVSSSQAKPSRLLISCCVYCVCAFSLAFDYSTTTLNMTVLLLDMTRHDTTRHAYLSIYLLSISRHVDTVRLTAAITSHRLVRRSKRIWLPPHRTVPHRTTPFMPTPQV